MAQNTECIGSPKEVRLCGDCSEFVAQADDAFDIQNYEPVILDPVNTLVRGLHTVVTAATAGDNFAGLAIREHRAGGGTHHIRVSTSGFATFDLADGAGYLPPGTPVYAWVDPDTLAVSPTTVQLAAAGAQIGCTVEPQPCGRDDYETPFTGCETAEAAAADVSPTAAPIATCDPTKVRVHYKGQVCN